MKTQQEYQQKQVLSLTDQIKKLQSDIVSFKKEKSEWESDRQRRVDALEALDKQTFAAKEAHKSLCASLDAEIESKKNELESLRQTHQAETESHARVIEINETEIAEQDSAIDVRNEAIKELVIQESNLRFSVSRLSTDKVLALKDAAKALDDNRKAVAKLSDTRTLIAQAEKDHESKSSERRKQADSLQAWQDRLDRRESDLNVLTERMHPEFVKIFGENKINAHVWAPSRP